MLGDDTLHTADTDNRILKYFLDNSEENGSKVTLCYRRIFLVIYSRMMMLIMEYYQYDRLELNDTENSKFIQYTNFFVVKISMEQEYQLVIFDLICITSVSISIYQHNSEQYFVQHSSLNSHHLHL